MGNILFLCFTSGVLCKKQSFIKGDRRLSAYYNKFDLRGEFSLKSLDKKARI